MDEVIAKYYELYLKVQKTKLNLKNFGNGIELREMEDKVYDNKDNLYRILFEFKNIKNINLNNYNNNDIEIYKKIIGLLEATLKKENLNYEKAKCYISLIQLLLNKDYAFYESIRNMKAEDYLMEIDNCKREKTL